MGQVNVGRVQVLSKFPPRDQKKNRPVLDVRLMTALQVLQVRPRGAACALATFGL